MKYAKTATSTAKEIMTSPKMAPLFFRNLRQAACWKEVEVAVIRAEGSLQ
jgi:hypothetical protein